MQARFIGFGEIEIDGQSYNTDMVIDNGMVHKRKKKLSKVYRGQYGHTPLSVNENIPWGGKHLIIGTGAYGQLPIMPDLLVEAEQRGTEVIAVPTDQACRLISEKQGRKVQAILHITC